MTTVARPAAVGKAAPTGKDVWSQLIAERITSPSASPPREASLLFIGPHSSGKSTLIQSFMFKDREEVPRPTLALDYRYTRTSVKEQMSEEKSLSHFWELGGGSTLKELMGVAVKEDDGMKDALVVIVVDCERAGRLVDDTLAYVDMARKKGEQLMQQMKANSSNVSSASQTSRRCSLAAADLQPTLLCLLMVTPSLVLQTPGQVAAMQKKRFGESHPDLSAIAAEEQRTSQPATHSDTSPHSYRCPSAVSRSARVQLMPLQTLIVAHKFDAVEKQGPSALRHPLARLLLPWPLPSTHLPLSAVSSAERSCACSAGRCGPSPIATAALSCSPPHSIRTNSTKRSETAPRYLLYPTFYPPLPFPYLDLLRCDPPPLSSALESAITCWA